MGKYNNLGQFFSQNLLKLNPNKTNFMIIQTLQKQNKSASGFLVISMGDEELDLTKSANLLW